MAVAVDSGQWKVWSGASRLHHQPNWTDCNRTDCAGIGWARRTTCGFWAVELETQYLTVAARTTTGHHEVAGRRRQACRRRCYAERMG